MGSLIGLVLGGLVVIAGFLDVFRQYDTVVLATPPWDESQLCHVALIHKNVPGQECTIEGPTNVIGELLQERMPGDVTRDTMYTTSMMAATIAVFGSTVIVVVSHVSKSAPLKYKLDASMVVLGPFVFALLHVWYATSPSIVDHLDMLPFIGAFSMLFLGITMWGVIGVLKQQT